MLDGQAVVSIAELARQSAAAKVVEVKGQRDVVWIQNNGSLTPVDIPPGPVNHRVDDLDSLLRAIKPYTDSDKHHVTIWVSREAMAVHACLDTTTRRRDYVHLVLQLDRNLVEFNRDVIGSRSQRQALVALRRLGASNEVLQKLSTIDWASSKEVSQTRGITQDRMGKSVSQRVAGEPLTSFIYECPFLANNGLRMIEQFKVLVEYDHDHNMIEFAWKPDSLEDVRHTMANHIFTTLSEDFDPDSVFLGEPQPNHVLSLSVEDCLKASATGG